jgi:signal transduction histidine kinase
MSSRLRRILIVDDSPEDRVMYRRLLRADSEYVYEFAETASGEEGLTLCEQRPFDCLLLDYRMPDVDGLSFLRRVRCDEEGVPVPIIVLTGQGSETVAVEALNNGAQDYVSKSNLAAGNLQRAVQNAIDKVSLVRGIRRRTRELSEANAELQKEVAQRKLAEQALQAMYAELEELVAARTAELSRINRELSLEVAERRRVEEERAQLLVREQQANRLKDEFLATVSHELRTPLNAVLGWARVLRSADVGPHLQERALEAIERNALAQSRLIEDILEVSRIVTGKLRLKVKRIDLAQVVDAAVDVVRPAAEAKEIALVRDIPTRPWTSLGDPDRLQQVVWNLLSNAVKFTPRRGSVHVALNRADGWERIVVTDTGKGIDPDFLPHVFAAFRQADASTTRDQGGLGLGLAIVRQLVEMHGGLVRADSEGVNRGAAFTVLLPAQNTSAVSRDGSGPHAAAASGTESGVPDLTGIRVIVVDDDPDARELMTETLGYYGADVTAAESAAEALVLLPEVRPDVLLSDIGMRGEDGYALIRRVRALPPDRGGLVPAVAVTAYAAGSDSVRALGAGFQLHIAKPFDPLELARIVHRLSGSAVNGPRG